MPVITRPARPIKPTEPSHFPERYNRDDYFDWLKSVYEPIRVETLDTLEDDYNKIQKQICDGFKESAFWVKLIKHSDDYEAEYRRDTGYELLATEPKLLPKPWESFLVKTYRKNKEVNKKKRK